MAMVSKSPWVVVYDGAGCNGCGLEAEVCFKPGYGLEKPGFRLVDNPKHGDILLLTGAVNEQNRSVIEQLYEQMPEPKAVLAVGDCACDGGAFGKAPNVIGGIGSVVPVDISVPGCATEPGKIGEALERVVELLDAKATERRQKLKEDDVREDVDEPVDEVNGEEVPEESDDAAGQEDRHDVSAHDDEEVEG